MNKWLQEIVWRLKRRRRHTELKRLVDRPSFDSSEHREEFEEFLVLETYTWVKRGFDVHVSVSDVPLRPFETTHWKTSRFSNFYGDFLAWETLTEFKKLVEEAEHEREQLRSTTARKTP